MMCDYKDFIIILFGNRKNVDNVCISMNNTCTIITRVRATKFLGVIIDEQLTWKDHISLLRSKLSKTVGLLYRVRHLLSRSALFILYCYLFLPYLTYCAEIWGNTYKSDTHSLQAYVSFSRFDKILGRSLAPMSKSI